MLPDKTKEALVLKIKKLFFHAEGILNCKDPSKTLGRRGLDGSLHFKIEGILKVRKKQFLLIDFCIGNTSAYVVTSYATFCIAFGKYLRKNGEMEIDDI